MPRDDIEVSTGSLNGDETKRAVIISDRKSGRCWSASSDTDGKAATEALKKFLGDRRAREYVE